MGFCTSMTIPPRGNNETDGSLQSSSFNFVYFYKLIKTEMFSEVGIGL